MSKAQDNKLFHIPAETMENKETQEWIKNRQSIIWEPELLISGIVLIGLLQIPELLDKLSHYLNDWGPSIFFTSNLDEVMAAFLKTSITFLIAGLIFNLFLRSIWVVMVGMSYLFPNGYSLEKFKFQPYYKENIERNIDFKSAILKLDQICSFTYSLTFFSFMCVVGMFFYLFVIGGIFAIIYTFFPIKNEFTDKIANTVLNVFLQFFGVIYFLDFISLGWFKRFKWFGKVYRPIYMVMSWLTLSPLYRNIYYAFLSRFNRWKIFAFIFTSIWLVWYILLLQLGDDVLFNKGKLISNQINYATYDGYYRDKEPKKISDWVHIPSAVVENDILEIFVAHKAVLEDSVLSNFERISGFKPKEVLENDSLKLEAMREFFRFYLNGEKLPVLPFHMFDYSYYNQKGLIGFIPLDSVASGTHVLELKLNTLKPFKVANVIFHKINDGSKIKAINNDHFKNLWPDQ